MLSLTASESEAPDRGGSNQHPALLQRQDCTLVAWYRCPYAPRTGGAYDSHHRTAGIAGCTWRHGSCVAARGARGAVSNADCGKTQPVRPALFLIGPMTAVSAAKLRGTLAFVTQRDGRFIVASTGRDASATCKA